MTENESSTFEPPNMNVTSLQIADFLHGLDLGGEDVPGETTGSSW